MDSKSNLNRKHVESFNPDISVLSSEYRDYLRSFNAGRGFEQFNDFLAEDAFKECENGDGVTHIIWNVSQNEDGEEKREIVAYYTLESNAIPYTDRIRLDEDEAITLGKEFDEEVCGISVLEIKMFAVHEKYQDMFYEFEGEDLPIAAWCIRYIVAYANYISESVLSFKALFLHAVPNSIEFYKKNDFQDISINMHPFTCPDSDFLPMWMPLKDIHMNYDK